MTISVRAGAAIYTIRYVSGYAFCYNVKQDQQDALSILTQPDRPWLSGNINGSLKYAGKILQDICQRLCCELSDSPVFNPDRHFMTGRRILVSMTGPGLCNFAMSLAAVELQHPLPQAHYRLSGPVLQCCAPRSHTKPSRPADLRSTLNIRSLFVGAPTMELGKSGNGGMHSSFGPTTGIMPAPSASLTAAVLEVLVVHSVCTCPVILDLAKLLRKLLKNPRRIPRYWWICEEKNIISQIGRYAQSARWLEGYSTTQLAASNTDPAGLENSGPRDR